MSSDWCSKISDDTPINELAIPGTHDSAAWTHYWNVWGIKGTWAQRKSITEQLNLGVRVLDMRVGFASNGYTFGVTSFVGMFHGPVYLSMTLEEVLTDISNWLGEHPEEFVILIFQQQGKPGQRDAASAVAKLVKDTFRSNLHHFIRKRSNWPTVGRLRGQVLAMSRLRSDVDGFCDVRTWLSTGDNTDGVLIEAGTHLRIYLQDRYKALSGADGYLSMAQDNKQKFAKVKAAARAAVPEVPYWLLLRINHMSYSNLRYQPWESGQGMNKLLRDSMLTIKGALMLDDADQDTVDYILGENARYYKNA